MKKVKKLSKILFSAYLLSAFIFSSGAVMPVGIAEASPQSSVTICHATSAHNNPYVENTVNKNAIINGGHNIHEGPIWYFGIKESWGDIIPPFTYGQASSTQHYAGKNWNNEGQNIWDNGCKVEFPVQKTDVTLCKEDEDGKRLGGWELALVSGEYTFSGKTDKVCKKTGCVTLKNVPYGTYKIEEELKDGWQNVSGLVQVEINQKKPTFIVVNKESDGPEDVFYALTATTTGFGWVTSSPEGINCGYGASDCEEDFEEGTEITLTATPGSGQKFDGWAGDCSGTSTTCSLTMDGAKSVSAAFSLIPGVTETVTIAAYKVVCENEGYLPDWAKTSSFPSMITEDLTNQYVADSDGKCWFATGWEFEWGEKTAAKKSGSYLGYGGEGWNTFGPTNSQGKATVEIDYLEGREYFWVREVLQEGYVPFSDSADGQTSVSAELLCHTDGYKYDNHDRVDNPQANVIYHCVAFNAPMEQINYFTVTFDGNGGTPTSTDVVVPGGETVNPLPTVTRDGFNFMEWNTKDDGTENEFTTSTIITTNITVYAQWQEIVQPTYYFLTATTTGFGWVTSSPAGINCGYEASDCSEEYLQGTGVTLTATPGSGQKFDGWAGDCSGTSTTCSLTMDGAKSVSAAFSLIPGVITYTVTFDGNGGTPTSTDIVVVSGETVNPLPTVTRDGFSFVGWNTENDGSGDEFTASTAVTDNITVYAIWQEKEKPIYGCTDPGATNYSPNATKDDGSCAYRRRSGGYYMPPGEVLGEEIVVEEPCGIYLYEFIKYGASNNPYEVQKLQIFLNQHMGSGLAVSGIYDWATMQALNQFQLQYRNEVLKPWVDAGTYCDVNRPTGYVYKTTQRWINLIMCPELNILMPDLSAYPKADCAGYWGVVLGEDIVVNEDGMTEGTVDEFEESETEEEEDKTMPIDIEEVVTKEPEEERDPLSLWLIAIIVLVAAVAIWFVYRGSKK